MWGGSRLEPEKRGNAETARVIARTGGGNFQL